MVEFMVVQGPTKGRHLAEITLTNYAAFETVCGLNNSGLRGNAVSPRAIRGPAWRLVKTNDVTCENCFNMAKKLHDAAS